MNAVVSLPNLQKRALAEWLEALGATLDLSETRLETARSAYESIGAWLANGAHPWLQDAAITPHGSTALGTAVSPLSGDEFDVDAMLHLPLVPPQAAPRTVKAVVGARLREHATYAAMLEEKARCWRLSYAGDFHLDLTPSIDCPPVAPPAVVVPDRPLERWLPSNPRGFRDWFDRRAALAPVAHESDRVLAKRGTVAPFPVQTGRRGVLRRVVQILKRHRDQRFADTPSADARPISIIITTLAAHAYEHVVLSQSFDNDFDVVVATVRAMPAFIRREAGPGERYRVENPTVRGENFADKWNRDPALPEAFFVWHERACRDLERLFELQGEDQLARHLNETFGRGAGSAVLSSRVAKISTARADRSLRHAAGVGLVTGTAGGVAVRPNTFFGR